MLLSVMAACTLVASLFFPTRDSLKRHAVVAGHAA